MNKYKQINKIHHNVFYQGFYHREVHTGTCTYMLKSTVGLYSTQYLEKLYHKNKWTGRFIKKCKLSWPIYIHINPLAMV